MLCDSNCHGSVIFNNKQYLKKKPIGHNTRFIDSTKLRGKNAKRTIAIFYFFLCQRLSVAILIITIKL